MANGQPVQFNDVFVREIVSLNKRRAKLGRPAVTLEPETDAEGKPLTTSDGSTPSRPTAESNVVGLSLSGGGIRSAAFCLGAAQALYEHDVLDKVDYLSTVSGGGYIGASLSSGMTANGGHFPFTSYLSEDETPSLQHVRDHSNYLFPEGVSDLVRNAAIYVRGLAANIVLVLPFLLLAAIVTIIFKPVGVVYEPPANLPDAGGFPLPALVGVFTYSRFALAIDVGLILLAVLIVWGFNRSRRRYGAANEILSPWPRRVGLLALLAAVLLFCQLQPFILDAIFAGPQKSFLAGLLAWIKTIALALTPLATALVFAAQKFGEVAKSALESERLRDQMLGYAAKAAIYVAAAILPVLLWALYLQFSYWGICATRTCDYTLAPAWLASVADYVPGAATGPLLNWAIAHLPACFEPWLLGVRHHVIAQLYFLIAVPCLIAIPFLRPNANSLHPLYRDRLSKAFLFKPEKLTPRDAAGAPKSLEALSTRLSELSEENAPYHLINTALNVQGSKAVNHRGRNADFFVFSKAHVGSRATGYVGTEAMEAAMIGFDLGAAMATSGAAASSSMGSATIKPLTPTLALLNIRLGYWLRNPRQLGAGTGWNRWTNFYFLLELLGRLDENRRSVYLTDGGHIENLGIYELLRRRCKVIIAVDAEADPQMAFGAFNVLERYALIDLGVRMDLPWQQVSDVSKATGKAIDEKGDAERKRGPHVAVGEIRYPGGRRGILVYIKSSITGDENDYIFHYKKRYGAFPHETTLDQFFSEEQFEAYRALGFHATHRFFDRRDRFAHLDPEDNSTVQNDVGFLDTFFPPPGDPPPSQPDPWPRKHKTFAEWLRADVAAEKDDAGIKRDDATARATVARAADKLAQAAEKAAATIKPAAP